MKDDRFTLKLLPAFMVLTNLVLSVVVVFLMSHVQNLLNSDVKINLTEIVTQNKDAITSRLMLHMNSLAIIANKITLTLGSVSPDGTDIQEELAAYALENNAVRQFVVGTDGIAVLPGGKKVDVSGRKYFRLAIKGIPNISDKIISRTTGDEAFVFSVPLYYKNDIIGTIQKVYNPEVMHEICTLSLFSAEGYIYIINSEGYVILHTPHRGCYQKSDNYFRDLYGTGNTVASLKLTSDIQQNRSGFVETTIGGQEIFSAYTRIEKIHDWYLITSVPNKTVSPNATTVIKLFYAILFFVVLIFSSSMTYFLWYKNKQKEQLETIAFVDSITSGNTYNKFLVAAGQALQKNLDTEYAIMQFDIDNFKYINNFYGFDYGDRILAQITKDVGKRLRSTETLARVYGDNFVVLLENADEKRLKRMLASIESPDITLCFTAGVYGVTDRNESINLMVDKANMAARSVKGLLTENLAYYTEKFDQQLTHNEQMKRAVMFAIEHNEFIPYFQPKVNVLDNRLTGAEALVRWITRDGKFVYPDEFIPLCEQTGLIVDIDMIVYEKCLKLLRGFMDEGVPCVPISVNFSRLHLLNEHFLDNVVRKRKAYNVPANLIEIELTESAMFGNINKIKEFTHQMHTEGFLVAMDDFGSGYSSLNMLKDVPIDILKIDKAFLSETSDNSRRNIIFSTIADMAKQLNMKVVVEGVEHLENVELMKECGCFIAQGYYFAKPMGEKDFEVIFRKGKVC